YTCVGCALRPILHSFPTRRSSDLVFNSSAGVKNELEKLWEYAAERCLPGLIVISGLDKEGTAWASLVEENEKALEIRTVPLSMPDRKSTRLNSSHVSISYAVFCLK